jgi:hypothetical protein
LLAQLPGINVGEKSTSLTNDVRKTGNLHVKDFLLCAKIFLKMDQNLNVRPKNLNY